MFQYAFYVAQSNLHKTVKADLEGYKTYPLHNGFELESIFNLSVKKASPFIIKLYDPTVRTWHIRKLRRILNLKNAYESEKDPFLFEEDKLKNTGSSYTGVTGKINAILQLLKSKSEPTSSLKTNYRQQTRNFFNI